MSCDTRVTPCATPAHPASQSRDNHGFPPPPHTCEQMKDTDLAHPSHMKDSLLSTKTHACENPTHVNPAVQLLTHTCATALAQEV